MHPLETWENVTLCDILTFEPDYEIIRHIVPVSAEARRNYVVCGECKPEVVFAWIQQTDVELDAELLCTFAIACKSIVFC